MDKITIFGTYSGEAVFDLKNIISGKIRLRLLMKFFLNPDNRVYLRGLAREFNVSTNTVRQELEKLNETGIIQSTHKNQKRLFRANLKHPLYSSIRTLMMQQSGVDVIYEYVLNKIGNLHAVYLTGPLARGTESQIIDIILVGDVNRDFLNGLILRAEEMTGKKVRVALYNQNEWNTEFLENVEWMKML